MEIYVLLSNMMLRHIVHNRYKNKGMTQRSHNRKNALNNENMNKNPKNK